MGERLIPSVTRQLNTSDQCRKIETLQDLLKSMEGPVHRMTNQLGSIEHRLIGLHSASTEENFLLIIVRR